MNTNPTFEAESNKGKKSRHITFIHLRVKFGCAAGPGTFIG